MAVIAQDLLDPEIPYTTVLSVLRDAVHPQAQIACGVLDGPIAEAVFKQHIRQLQTARGGRVLREQPCKQQQRDGPQCGAVVPSPFAVAEDVVDLRIAQGLQPVPFRLRECVAADDVQPAQHRSK